jgi:ankyrin repeat protein
LQPLLSDELLVFQPSTHIHSACTCALHFSCCNRKGWVDGVRLLLAAGAEVDVANKRGLSALGEAVAGGHADAAEALLGAAADPNWRSAG